MENRLDEYVKLFKEYPPLVMEFPYENEDYQKMIEWSLINEKKLTDELVEKFIDEWGIETGVVRTNQGETDMEKEKIENLLLKYGAPKDVVKDFMDDLYEIKQDTEKMDEFEKDENKGSDEYKDFAKDNNIDENDSWIS